MEKVSIICVNKDNQVSEKNMVPSIKPTDFYNQIQVSENKNILVLGSNYVIDIYNYNYELKHSIKMEYKNQFLLRLFTSEQDIFLIIMSSVRNQCF